ncbi:MAG: hypothetical protein ACI956_001653 [Nonlabens sp.]
MDAFKKIHPLVLQNVQFPNDCVPWYFLSRPNHGGCQIGFFQNIH